MKKKINWLLILQGWAMLWVVIGHSPLSMNDSMPQYVKILYDFAYSFHMPLFILVSGFLFEMTRISPKLENKNTIGWREGYKWTWSAIMLDKLQRLGIPFIVFTIIAMVVKSLFPGDMARQTDISISTIFHSIIYPGDGPLGELWFIATLLWYFAFVPLWRFVSRYYIYEALLFLALIILHFVHFDVNGLLCIENMLYYSIYFYVGILVSKYNIVDVISKWKWYVLLASVVFYIVAIYYNFGNLATWFAIAGSIGLALILDRYLPKSFCVFRNYTYQIFLISIFVQIAVKMVYKRLDMPYVVAYMFCILAGLYVPVIISKILEKINWKPLLLCVGLKEKNEQKKY